MILLLRNHLPSFLIVVLIKVYFVISGKNQTCVLFMKKGDKQTINNHWTVSLLPVCGKIFERLIFNSFYKYLEDNKLVSVHQSGFWSRDSCVNQFFSILHNLNKAFYAYPTLETCGVFLDMSKAFDKVWHEGLIFKLNSVVVSDSLLCLILLKVS